MQQRKTYKTDKMGIGFLSGLLLPILIFFIVFLASNQQVSFLNYIKGMWHMHALLKLGSLCVFTNLALFWVFLKLKHDKAARGVLGATLLYALTILISRSF